MRTIIITADITDEQLAILVNEIKTKTFLSVAPDELVSIVTDKVFHVVAWTEEEEVIDEKSIFTDFYNRYDNEEEAQAKYDELLEFENIYSISYCIEVDGTDV